jgi:phosphoribosyl 1,2-cyclic phosphate phosphodiesterase
VKVRILGCGTSSGVPRIGNDWGACDPSHPRNRRLRSSILVDSGGETLLVDCGPDLLAQMNAAGRDRVDRVIVTHDHADHCHGIDDLRQVAHVTHHPVPLYARADVLEPLKARFSYAFDGTPAYPGVLKGQLIDGDMGFGAARLRFVAADGPRSPPHPPSPRIIVPEVAVNRGPSSSLPSLVVST